MDPRKISIQSYNYKLPAEKVALHPLRRREDSRLLISRGAAIGEAVFRELPSHLPNGALIVFNNARVVEARIIFQKPTGGKIEVFCLEPGGEFTDPSLAFAQTGSVTWNCLVGNASAWMPDLVLTKECKGCTLSASLVNRNNGHFEIRFNWFPIELSFADVLHAAGDIPLPPYIKRKTEADDTNRYQTVYADKPGSVAAPTAGLHFTDDVLDRLSEKNISRGFVTLHVGAGTFQPVKASELEGHEMHAEFIEVKKSFIEQLIQHSPSPVIAVGTTSLRTLESLYWIGRNILAKPNHAATSLVVTQWQPYETDVDPDVDTTTALTAVLDWMNRNGETTLVTKTQLLIAPPYQFRVVDVLITNFHQPGSTLLLLVAAFIGDSWKNVYDYALDHGFRFLSYGDACLLYRKEV